MIAARNSLNSALGGDFVHVKSKSIPGGSVTFGRFYHVKNQYVEYFYGNAYYNGIKIQVLYDFKEREAFGDSGCKVPPDQWIPVWNELQQYLRDMEQEYKSLHK